MQAQQNAENGNSDQTVESMLDGFVNVIGRRLAPNVLRAYADQLERERGKPGFQMEVLDGPPAAFLELLQRAGGALRAAREEAEATGKPTAAVAHPQPQLAAQNGNGGMRPALTEDQRRKAVLMSKNGANNHEIAKELGCAPSTVWKIVNPNGVTKKRVGRGGYKVSPEIRARVLEMTKAGDTAVHIAAELGLGKSTVQTIRSKSN